mgnify:CR=1 FL=1
MLLMGLILIIIVCICVKLFDGYIRPRHMLKVLVNTSTFAGLIMIIAGIVQLFL